MFRSRSSVTLFGMVSLALGPLLLSSSKVLACSCQSPPPPCYSYWQSDAVFVGRVSKIARVEDSYFERVEVSVEESFKGMDFPIALTDNFPTSCSFSFEEDQRFLFYTSISKNRPDFFGAGLCTGTKLYSADLVDFEFLRAVKNGESNYWIWVTIPGGFNYDGVQGVKAEVIGKKGRLTGESDKDGNIKILVPGSGKYNVRVWIPKGKEWSGALRYDEAQRNEQTKIFKGGGKNRAGRYMDFSVDVTANRCGWIYLPLMSSN